MKKSITFLLFFMVVWVSSIFKVESQSCNCWAKRDSTFSPVPFAYDYVSTPTPPYYRNDDGYTNVIVLPFHFCFWGKKMDSIFINNNGNVSFGTSYSTFTSDTFPTSNIAMIAPFWADVDTRPESLTMSWDVVYYKITPTYMIVQWDSVGVYKSNTANDTNQLNSFQLIMSDGSDPIIPNGNNVEFCYKEMQWTTGTASGGGANGFGGSPATVGANEGDGVNFVQFGLFDTAGTNYISQYPPGPHYDGVGWLVNKTLIFNTCSNTIPPLTSGITPCDTFKVCLGDSILVPFYFYSPTQGDTVWSNLSPPIPPGVTIVSNLPGPTDSLTIKIVGNTLNYGYNTINVYGYDNALPPDTTFTSFVVEVDTAPRISLHVYKDTICVGDTSFLTAGGGKYYSWSNGATTAINNVTPNVTQTYTVGISNGGCTKDTTIKVVVLPIPNPSITAKPDTVCPKDSVLLIANGGGRYTWSTGRTTDSIWVRPDSTTVYGLYATNGICADSTTYSVFVTKPGTSTLALLKDSLCPFDTTTLTVSGGTSYRWSNGASTSSITITPDSTRTYTVIVSVVCATDSLVKTVHVIQLPKPVVKGRFIVCKGYSDTLTVSGGTKYLWSNGDSTTSYKLNNITGDSTVSVQLFNGKCYVDTTVRINVEDAPNVTVKPGLVCEGQCIQLTANDTGSHDTYKWNNGATTDTTTVCPPDTALASYTVTAYNSGCSTKRVTTVSIYPVALYACCPQTITLGDSATMTSDSGRTYTWSPAVKCITPLCDSVKVSPSVTTTYTVTGVDSNGCLVSRVVTILVEIPCSDFTVPNVFTPNGDGINDLFVIATKYLDAYSILIYDRWGKQMFKTTNPTDNWDGNTEGGAKAPDGVYYYIITSTCNGKNYDKQGFVQLIR